MVSSWRFAICAVVVSHGACMAAEGPHDEYLPARTVQMDTAFEYKKGESSGILYLAARLPRSWANTRVRCTLGVSGKKIKVMDGTIASTGSSLYVFKKIEVDVTPLIGAINKIRYEVPFDINCRSGQVTWAPYIQMLNYGFSSYLVESVEQNESGRIVRLNLATLAVASPGQPKRLTAPEPVVGEKPNMQPNVTCAIYNDGGLLVIAATHVEYIGNSRGRGKITLDRPLWQFTGIQCRNGGFAD